MRNISSKKLTLRLFVNKYLIAYKIMHKIKKHINKGNYVAGADEMKDVTNGGTAGLVKRRKAEINMFKNNVYDSKH